MNTRTWESNNGCSIIKGHVIASTGGALTLMDVPGRAVYLTGGSGRAVRVVGGTLGLPWEQHSAQGACAVVCRMMDPGVSRLHIRHQASNALENAHGFCLPCDDQGAIAVITQGRRSVSPLWSDRNYSAVQSRAPCVKGAKRILKGYFTDLHSALYE